MAYVLEREKDRPGADTDAGGGGGAGGGVPGGPVAAGAATKAQAQAPTFTSLEQYYNANPDLGRRSEIQRQRARGEVADASSQLESTSQDFSRQVETAAYGSPGSGTRPRTGTWGGGQLSDYQPWKNALEAGNKAATTWENAGAGAGSEILDPDSALVGAGGQSLGSLHDYFGKRPQQILEKVNPETEAASTPLPTPPPEPPTPPPPPPEPEAPAPPQTSPFANSDGLDISQNLNDSENKFYDGLSVEDRRRYIDARNSGDSNTVAMLHAKYEVPVAAPYLDQPLQDWETEILWNPGLMHDPRNLLITDLGTPEWQMGWDGMSQSLKLAYIRAIAAGDRDAASALWAIGAGITETTAGVEGLEKASSLIPGGSVTIGGIPIRTGIGL